VAEGATADHFYAIASGAAEVTKSGHHRADLGAGDHFGEIALLGGTTRTATVTTTAPTRLVVIDGVDFVDALSSSDAAFAVGSRVVGEHLARDQA
jgi:CRP-like cAMP-binding protein